MPRGRRKKESTDPVFLKRKNEAIALGRACVTEMMERYTEPSRRGVAKGDPIGLSRKKKKAAAWMILFPCLQLRKIGKLVGVSEKQIQVWNSKYQEAFEDAIKESCKWVGIRIRNTVQRGVEKIEDPETLKPYLTIPGVSHPHIALLLLLPFFTNEVMLPTLNLINEKIESKDFRYSGLLEILSEAIYFRKDKNLEGWIKSPIRLATIKNHIASLCTITMGLILYPDRHREFFRDIDRKESAQNIRQLQELLFEQIDMLGSKDLGGKKGNE